MSALVADGAVDVDELDESSGWASLHYACNAGHPDVVRCLLDDGYADPDLLSRDGTTPVFCALAHVQRLSPSGNVEPVVEVLRLLVDRGADVTMPLHGGQQLSMTPLLALVSAPACTERIYLPVATVLLSAGSMVPNIDVRDGAVARKALANGNMLVVGLLMAHKAPLCVGCLGDGSTGKLSKCARCNVFSFCSDACRERVGLLEFGLEPLLQSFARFHMRRSLCASKPDSFHRTSSPRDYAYWPGVLHQELCPVLERAAAGTEHRSSIVDVRTAVAGFFECIRPVYA